MCLCSGGTPSHYYFPLTVNGVVISVSLYYCIVLLYRLFKTLYPVKWLCCITATGFIKAWLSRMRSQTGQHLDKMINLCLLIYKMADFSFLSRNVLYNIVLKHH